MRETMAHVNGNRKKEWDLSGRRLKALPQSLFTQGKDARRVDLQRNKLRQVNGMSTLVHLTELNLSRNEMVEFPQEICQLHNLERLYLNQNNIRSIPEAVFPQLGKLQFLKMSTNHLTELPSDMNQCTSLTYLSLSKNCLQDLQPLVGLRKLKELLVERNQLTELPSQLFQIDSCELTMCKVTGNPLRCPPEEVCIGGVQDIQSYFCQMEENPSTQSTWTVKTMFLGSSMAGKSTLCRSLKQGQPVEVAEEDRTEGIEISELYTQNVRFLFWDFAGQEEYYLTHHVFITPWALVILAVNLSSYSIHDRMSFKEKVWFWINNIQLRVPGSVVLLVGTHCDQCQDEEEVTKKKRDIEEKIQNMLADRNGVLKQQKKNLEDSKNPSLFSDQMSELDCLLEYNLQVLDLITIDCTSTEDIARLRGDILKYIHSENIFPCAERILPKSYEEVELAIYELLKGNLIPQHGIVLLEELHDLILAHVDLNRESLHSILRFLLRYLHRIGIIVWYEEFDALSDRVFIRPSLLISLFKTIVRHDLVQQLEGIPRDLLRTENILVKQKRTWVDNLNSRGTLHNAAIRILVRREMEEGQLVLHDDEDLVNEMVGSSKEEGMLINLLQHFEICLPTNVGSPLNPQAPVFVPGEAWRNSTGTAVKGDPDAACLFPSYLKDNHVVSEKWGEDKLDDLNVHVYLLPEIPHSFFHRLIIKTCTLYPTHWVGRDQCLLCCGNRLLLFKQKSEEGDPFIEIRCKRPENSNESRQSWDLILAVMSKLSLLSRQWPGLTEQVHSPCPERGCQHYFTWRDWQDLSKSDIYELVQEEKLVCQGGHTRRTELIFPKEMKLSGEMKMESMGQTSAFSLFSIHPSIHPSQLSQSSSIMTEGQTYSPASVSSSTDLSSQHVQTGSSMTSQREVKMEDEEGGAEIESKKVEGQPDVKMEEKPEGTIPLHGELEEHPVKESQSSLHPSLELQDETDQSSCFSGLRIEESISLPRSHSLPSLSQMPCLENIESFRAKRSHSVNDVTLLDKTQKITPDIIVVENKESYRFHCTQAGLFQCNVTDLVFKMKTEGDVTYRTVHWDRRLLSQLDKRPAGPLFDIKGSQGCVCQLQFPHCEILSMGGGKSLSVLHVMDDDGFELIKPHVITKTHVIIDVTGLSLFGIIKEMLFGPSPVQALVSLFYTPPIDDDHPSSILKVLLLPRNVVLREVKKERKEMNGEEIYIGNPPCKLIPKQEYTLSTSPQDDSIKIQPNEAEFEVDESSHRDYIETFDVILKQRFTSVSLLLRSSKISDCPWKRDVDLSAAVLRKQRVQRTLSHEAKDKLLSVRSSFIDSVSHPIRRQQVQCTLSCPAEDRLSDVRISFINSVSDPVLNNVLDKLLHKGVIIREEYDNANVKQVTQDKARFVIDAVRNKGTAASSSMISFLCETDPFLSKHLGLM